MRNQGLVQRFVILAGAALCVVLPAVQTAAQRPGGPPQDGAGGPRPGGQRPGAPGRPGGLPAGFVPGDYLGTYLGLTAQQQQKLDRLMKTIDALGRENFRLPAFTQLKLTDDQIGKIGAGVKVRDVLNAEQQQILEENRRPGPGGPGGFGRPGGPNGGRPGGPGGRGDQGGPGGPPPALSDNESASKPTQARLLPNGVTRTAVVFSGGHETDPRDHGRPVVLVAAGLGVPPQVFRDAFSHVRPARAGTEPEPGQVQQNKAALLNALGKYGITNDLLDTVSNYYRYVPGRGGLWTNRPASANALIKDGAVVGYEITDAGAGYSSVPTVSVPGVRDAGATVELSFSKRLNSNGSIAAIRVSQEKAK